MAKPATAVTCGTAGICLLVAAAPAIVIAPDLAALGFGSNGVVHGVLPNRISFGCRLKHFIPSLILASSQDPLLHIPKRRRRCFGVARVYGVVPIASGAVVSSTMGILAWTEAYG
ncbi:hypothetical protein PG987_013767 [Apiospora arundinis]